MQEAESQELGVGSWELEEKIPVGPFPAFAKATSGKDYAQGPGIQPLVGGQRSVFNVRQTPKVYNIFKSFPVS